MNILGRLNVRPINRLFIVGAPSVSGNTLHIPQLSGYHRHRPFPSLLSGVGVSLKMADSRNEGVHSSHGDGEVEQPEKDETSNQQHQPVKRLYAFDFDHTVIEENSDYEVKKLLKSPVPPEIESRCTGTTFTAYMDEVMKFLGSQGVTIQEIGAFMKTLKFVPGMEDLFQKIAATQKNDPRSQFVIVSDANSFFIKTILSTITPQVQPNAIFTNTTIETKVLDESTETKNRFTYLQVVPFDNQTDCDICPPNLCKGKVLRNYLKKHGPFENVYYVGDGHNDFCPARELTSNDTLFVRRGFKLEKMLSKSFVGKHSTDLKCSKVFWDDANDIAPCMQF